MKAIKSVYKIFDTEEEFSTYIGQINDRAHVTLPEDVDFPILVEVMVKFRVMPAGEMYEIVGQIKKYMDRKESKEKS